MSSGVETSLDIFNSKRSQRSLDFARNDGHEDTTSRLFSSLHIYHDNSPHSAAKNMAIDEALLEHATVASIRFYGWHSPALSFGYFGRFADVGRYAAERELVRRWTGGGTVFHGNDLTYSIVIPANDAAFAESSMSIYEKIHRALREALIGMGGHAQLATPDSAVTDRLYNAGACFANPVRADVMVNGCKVAGAAQRRTRAGLYAVLIGLRHSISDHLRLLRLLSSLLPLLLFFLVLAVLWRLFLRWLLWPELVV